VRPRSPLWYLAALFLALGAWMIGAVVASGAWDIVRDASVTSSTAPLAAADKSVAVFTDVVQPERRVTCSYTVAPAKKGAKPQAIEPAPIDLTIADDGTEWYLIGFVLDGKDGMSVACTPRDKRTDNASYAVSAVDGFSQRANVGNGIAILGTVAGIILGIWTFINRRRRLQEADDASP